MYVINKQNKTYKKPRHDPIRHRQSLNPILRRQRKHDIQERHKPRRLHRRPPDLAGDVEARFRGRFAHRVVVYDPLEECVLAELGLAGVLVGKLGGKGGKYDGEELPEEGELFPVIA
jgi:hypothetical protein